MFFVSCSRVRYDPTDGDIDDSIIATLPSSTSSYVSSDSVCSLIANKSGWFGMYCGGYFVGDLYNALDSSNSKNNGACTMEDNAKGDGYDVYCSGKKQGDLHNGNDGATGQNGNDGADGVGCTATPTKNGDIEMTCGKNGTPVTLQKGEKGDAGTSCKVVAATDPSHDYEIQCADGTHEYVDNGKGCKMDKGTGFSVITCGAVSDTFYVNPGDNAICGFDSTAVAYNTLKKKCFNDRIVSEFGEMTDTRDGKVYKTVYFRDLNQTWMAENLNYLPTDSIGICPMNSQDSCEKYGRLYMWGEATNSLKDGIKADGSKGCSNWNWDCQLPRPAQGICPPGWRLPDSTDLDKLQELGSIMTVANQRGDCQLLKKDVWYYYDDNQNKIVKDTLASDAFGFSLLPGGEFQYDNDFNLRSLQWYYYRLSDGTLTTDQNNNAYTYVDPLTSNNKYRQSFMYPGNITCLLSVEHGRSSDTGHESDHTRLCVFSGKSDVSHKYNAEAYNSVRCIKN